MLDGSPSRTSLEDGLRAAVTAFGIDEAQRTGQVVDLLPLWNTVGIDLTDKPQKEPVGRK